MDDLDEELEDDEFIGTDNLDYYVPMSDTEREEYEGKDLSNQAEMYGGIN